ncbi:MAG: NADH-quinone oxidoreductase subunit NuoK [Flavobacteriales bacterium CG_4_9_14_0_2_um_filter_35_242]|jgi:NADH-quinone oxidoreductase subunit K|nr:NADH-quinone oxidoreductase subunit NuoK [Zetaproteobacteria bacterium]NDK17962.1 NADH-quinone oxidoreductase subunit NuoK [Flavobacteriales bacterium]OIO12541.1 MAG: NADH-quinone oxidoreductase subunit K [Flavobacteriaceae bacterium CG1_02_35_72]PIR14850.1 MAG: NADH-quinone oxidoreductase subunit NuoK [Flavobacteriales bacterium CG11_big_fil_rev_8_21_14_0_20_35_7]PIV18280.1 MAG: NADH-quinone oxidoreductase subunit NuoK [Flavobacteriales bacterium CG03_land_8_20_14_0_80_35_15]PIX07533.1 MAG
MISGISIYHILTLTSILFFIGVYGFITRKNLIAILISIELILNASVINFVIFNTYLYPNRLEGVFFSIFIIAIAAAESALAVSIIVSFYRMIASVAVKDTETLKY